MKHSIEFTDMKILEINQHNLTHTHIFKQGKNKNSNARAPKISIKNKDINNFLIYYSKF